MTRKLNLKTYLKSSGGVIALTLMSAGMASSALAQDSDDDVVVVTGSRIATDSALSAPSPVQTISLDDFVKSGDIDIAMSLRNIPALQGSRPANLDLAAGGVGTGASTLNLRGLGTNRTLVLQDGRRHVPGGDGGGAF